MAEVLFSVETFRRLQKNYEEVLRGGHAWPWVFDALIRFKGNRLSLKGNLITREEQEGTFKRFRVR